MKKHLIISGLLLSLTLITQNMENNLIKPKKEEKKLEQKQKLRNLKNTEKFHKSIEQLNLKDFKKLLKKVDVNNTDQMGNTALNVAANMVIKVCIIDKYKKDRFKYLSRLRTMIVLLLNNQADKSIKNEADKTAFDKLDQFKTAFNALDRFKKGSLTKLLPNEQKLFDNILMLVTPSQPKTKAKLSPKAKQAKASKSKR